MQYILTEEEYKSLVPKWKYDAKLKEIKELQLLLMKATGHTCRYEFPDNYDLFYCDKCPIANFDCGRRKEFSK